MNRNRSTICALLLTGLLTSCANNQLMGTDEDQARFLDTNYYTFDHDFTEKATADVRARAERLCGYQKLVAIETERACTIKMCVTSYQCVKAKDVKAYGL